jgi:hypothetical protein
MLSFLRICSGIVRGLRVKMMSWDGDWRVMFEYMGGGLRYGAFL